VSTLGTYEDNLSPTGEGGIADPTIARRSGTTGLISGEGEYRYGHTTRFLEADGQAYVHSFRNIGVTPMYGGSFELRGSSRLGRRSTVTGGAGIRWQPSFSLTPMTGADDIQTETAPTDPTSGVLEMRTRNVSGSSTLTHSWNLRHRTNMSYGYSQFRATGVSPVQSQSQEAALGHNWDLRRSVSLLALYQYQELRSDVNGLFERPSDTQTGNLGVELRRRISRTRTVSISGGGGAMHVSTVSSIDGLPLRYVAPSGYASARMDIGRTWSVSFDARRDVSVLEGLSTQSFLTNMMTAWAGGRIGRDWLLTFSGSFSDGTANEGDVGSFTSSNGMAQLQYSVMRCCTIITGYSFYTHRLRDVAAVPLGFPSHFDRNAVSVGFSMWMPFYGSFAGTGRS
jgi:hypothetical protein